MKVSNLLRYFSSLLFLVLLLLSTIFFSNFSLTYAEVNCDNPTSSEDLNVCIEKIEEEIAALKPAHEYNKQELAGLRAEINSLNKQINGISAQLNTVEKSIGQREEDLAFAQEIFEAKANSHYKFLRLYDPILPFLSSSNASEAFREISFRQKAADEDRMTMEAYAEDLIALREDKEGLERNSLSLAAIKKKIDERESFLSGEVEKVASYIATLSAKQKQFIDQKLGSLNLPTSLGAGPLFCTDDRNLDPRFSPAFAFYTYGIPHRVGMNQYGAYGRANSGQTYDEILRAYFNIDGYREGVIATISVNNSRKVNEGSIIWTGSLEDYVKRIYEVPESWPAAALKAQAIAARSYVLSVTNNGTKSICATTDCQVFKKDPKGGAWEGAVNETTGKVLVQGGQIITAWFASTAGGYTFTSAEVWGGGTGWTKNLRDTTSGVSSFGDLNSSSYDKDSPCFYAAQGWRSEYGNSAWLKSEEVADIVNTLLLVKKDHSVAEHLYPIDWSNPVGTDTWSIDKVKQELQENGITPLNGVSNISISADFSSGRTTTVNVDGHSFTGQEFKERFNLRAPANIQIVGPLFNVERK